MGHRRIKLGLQFALGVGFALELYEGQWLNATLVLFILLLVTFLPNVLARGLDLFVPPEIELLAIGFVFASVFLGDTRDCFGRSGGGTSCCMRRRAAALARSDFCSSTS